MHPLLFTIGRVEFPSYGALYLAAYVTAGLLAGREARRLGHSPWTILGAIVVGVSGAWLGSRLLFLLLHGLPGAAQRIDLFRSGTTYLGAIVGFTAAVALYGFAMRSWRPATPTIRGYLDIFGTVVPLGQAIGRVGCFLAGCCYGSPTDGFLGVTYHASGIAAPRGIPLHPTQLYEAAGELALFGLLWSLRRRRRFEGQLVLTYLVGYGSLRFGVEFFRGDAQPAAWGLDTIQWLCLPVVFAGLVALLVAWTWTAQREKAS